MSNFCRLDPRNLRIRYIDVVTERISEQWHLIIRSNPARERPSQYCVIHDEEDSREFDAARATERDRTAVLSSNNR